METKHIFGEDYQVVSTASALRAINEFYGFQWVEDPKGTPYDEQVWWQVGIFSDRSELWMNNCDGEILIITKGDESYYRRF